MAAAIKAEIIEKFEKSQKWVTVTSFTLFFWYFFITVFCIVFRVDDIVWIGWTMVLVSFFLISVVYYYRCPVCGIFIFDEEDSMKGNALVLKCSKCKSVLKVLIAGRKKKTARSR